MSQREKRSYGLCIYGVLWAVGRIGRNTELPNPDPIDADGLLDLAAGHDLRSVEIASKFVSPQLDEKELRDYRTRADELGVGITVTGPQPIKAGQFRRHIELAGLMGSPALRCTMSGLLEGNRAPLGGYEGWSAHVEHGAAGETATDGLKDAARVDARLLRQIPGNTYVIFTSDHGEMLGDHYRYHKSAGYEGSARIPLLISGPGIEACTVREEPAGWHDILPTILDYAGVDCPERVDGRSMRPLSRIAPGDLCETGASVPRLK